MTSRRLKTTAGLAIAVAGTWAARRLAQGWGATAAERSMSLPGDELVEATVSATRAISINARPGQVWPWLIQMGQQRGGFYSYDWLENLAGLGIHSATTIENKWQDLDLGDRVQLADDVALTVAQLDPSRALVLYGSDQNFNPGQNTVPFDFTWSFVLAEGERTRLVVRERYRTEGAAGRALVELVGGVSFLMSERMLRGIRDRAEGRYS